MIVSAPSWLASHLRRRALARCHRTAHGILTRNIHATAIPASELGIGASIHGFTLQRKLAVPELQLTALQLRHERTGADYLHIDRDDPNNVFSIGFKTNPPDDTGVPHILEHTTLCGSQRYPVRDPFFNMLPRSLSNFMNAFTAADHTTYPFATTNRQDFRNLMSVYLDATLKPLLKEQDFVQEGWRLAPENVAESPGRSEQELDVRNNGVSPTKEPQTGLTFKGVVYNEMKGQMSDSSYYFYVRFMDHFFPAIHNSGGDPQRMTKLSYQQLKDFHLRNYHPSNARLFSYGSMSLLEHLAEVDLHLKNFDKQAPNSDIREPIKLDKPVKAAVDGPIDPLVDRDAQYKTSVTWLLGSTSDTVETFALGILTSILLDGYGSPLYRALVEAGLGTDFAPNTGLDFAGTKRIFSVGVNGVKASDVKRIQNEARAALQLVREQGVAKDKVEALLHQMELSLKHKNANFGLDLMNRLQPGWFNGIDAFDMLAWNRTLHGFRERYASEGYLESLLDQYFLVDQIFTFTMVPSETFESRRVEEEQDRLRTISEAAVQEAGCLSNMRQRLAAKEARLIEAQEAAQHQDLSSLPRVRVSDVPRAPPAKALRDGSVEEVAVQWRETATNGLTYMRAIQVLDGLPDELRNVVPLFCDALLRLGTPTCSTEQLENLIKSKTGGIQACYFSTGSPHNLQAVSEGLSFSSYCLDRHVPEMYRLLEMLIRDTDFTGPRAEAMIRELLKGEANNALNAVANEGHAYARRYAAAGLHPAAALSEEISGLTQVRRVAELASRSESESPEDLVTKLRRIQDMALARSPKLRVAITCGHESTASNEKALHDFIDALPTTEAASPSPAADSLRNHVRPQTFFEMPYQVSYVGYASSTVPWISPSSAPLQVLAQLITHRYMLREIREKGGAYGAGAYASSLGGLFGFFSYRDPDPAKTMEAITDIAPWFEAQVSKWGAQELEEAKLGIFQSLDAPESVNEEGMRQFLTGITQQMDQTKREQLLDVTLSQVRNVAEQYVLPQLDRSRKVVLGPKQDWIHSGDAWDSQSLSMSA